MLANLDPQTKLRCQIFQHHRLAANDVIYEGLQEALQGAVIAISSSTLASMSESFAP